MKKKFVSSLAEFEARFLRSSNKNLRRNDYFEPIFIEDELARDIIDAGLSEVSIWDSGELSELEWRRVLNLPDGYCYPNNDLLHRELSMEWCYLPWSNTLIRIPSEYCFLTFRTFRNLHKITIHEQKQLFSKKVGVIGLSVGQAVVKAIVLERLCGEIRIADFDKLELTNLNRIEASISDLGLDKTTITARRIAEVDPYMAVRVFNAGINSDNIEDFLLGGGKLDLVIEECDSGDVKLLTRKLCRKHGIPVLMETSDRGLLDVERYDLEPNLPLLHGMFDEADEHLNLSDEAKRNLLLKAIDFTKVSERGIQSMSEIGKSITSWPQLATDVVSGGATAAMAARLILLGHGLKSGRVYVDIQSRIFEALGASAFNSEGES